MAERYGTFGQVTGKEITEGGNIIDLISLEGDEYVSAIGVHTDPTREVTINGSPFYIGDTGTLEFQDVNITSVKFPINEDWHIDDRTVVTFAISNTE